MKSRVVLATLLAVLLTGCSSARMSASLPAGGREEAVRLSQPPVGAVREISQRIGRSYIVADWSSVQSLVTDPASARALVQRLKFWKREGVAGLNITVTSMTRLGPNRFAAAVRFSADPRVVPYWAYYLVARTAVGVRFVKYVTGLSGPNYGHATWAVDRTAHFVLYHSPYALRGQDRHYLRDLESQRAAFARRFRVRLPPLASFYLYPNLAAMSALTRRTNEPCGIVPGELGCTYPYAGGPTIHGVAQSVFHEPIHVYELALVPPPPNPRSVYVAPLFIGEGTAVALQNRQLDPRLSDYCSDLRYVSLDTCARYAIRRLSPMTILSDKRFKRSDLGAAYSLGGSFVKYLILRYGYYRFGRFYYRLAGRPSDTEHDYDVASLNTFGIPIRRLVGDWKSRLCAGACSPG